MVKYLFSRKAANITCSTIKTIKTLEGVKICSKLTIKTLERRQ